MIRWIRNPRDYGPPDADLVELIEEFNFFQTCKWLGALPWEAIQQPVVWLELAAFYMDVENRVMAVKPPRK